MDWNFIKRYLPNSLFGRALLILLMPVVILQLIVGSVFISRHFEGVTHQLAQGVALDLAYVLSQVQKHPDQIDTLGDPFQLDLQLSPKTTVTPGLTRRFYDLSGRYLTETLTAQIDYPMRVDLVQDPRRVVLEIDMTPHILEVKTLRKRVSASNPHQLLVLMVGASLILVLVAVLFLRNQVKPIRRLAAAAEAFGKGRSEQFRPSGAVEVRRAGHAFLAMRGRIERHVVQRTQMLSGVSHDLRTPLTRLKLSLEMLGVDDIEAAEMRHDIVEMEKMVDAFLDFSTGDQGEDIVELDPVKLAEQLVADMRRSGTPTTIRDVRGSAPMISCRKLAVTRALQNLLNNAARHGDQVRLSLMDGGSFVEFSIEDNGPGIPETQREAALRPFTRLDPARNLNKGSNVGLGLTIALDVARGHGGALTLSDSADLGGLKACLRLPQ